MLVSVDSSVMFNRAILFAVLLFSVSSSLYGNELIINDREWVFNGSPVLLDGSIDQVIQVIGQPSYESSHRGPSDKDGQNFRYIWVNWGFIVYVQSGCIDYMDIRIAPLLKSEIHSWSPLSIPEDNPFPRFPGSVKIGSLDIQPDTNQKNIQANKAPPKFRGTDTFPAVNYKEVKQYYLAIDRSPKGRTIESINIRSHYKRPSAFCSAKAVTPQYSFESRHLLYEKLIVKPIEKDVFNRIIGFAMDLFKWWVTD